MERQNVAMKQEPEVNKDGAVVIRVSHRLYDELIANQKVADASEDPLEPLKTHNIIEAAYADYWNHVKDSVDEQGWAYNNELPHLIDYYFDRNTGKEIDFEKHYEGKWRGVRWRPKELAELLK
jgi:hypothetical protein